MAAILSRKLAPQMMRVFAPSSVCGVNSCVLRRSFATAEKITYIKDDDTYHTLKSGSKPCIMNFSATWCGPCKMMAPQFAALSSAYDSVNFVKIDVDNSPNLTMEEHITSVPTYLLYKNNKLIEQFAGADVNRLKKMIVDAEKA
ncbi:hypothetical protein WA538_002869 [Blastocystis sp. DL]